ncbi:putative expansin, cellulose-binding-like domain-containing protein [Helianthus annuus]|nr:putative expansin, cellulose-binding-like domain-containing protein [Helianthus annuus]
MQEDCKEWRCMRRAYGAVWDMQNPPEGAIDLRFQVSGSKWIQLKSLILVTGRWELLTTLLFS